MAYTFEDHLHNFAVWTSARAVQRNFTNTENIEASIKKAKLRELINSAEILSGEEFDKFHRETAKIIISHLERQGIYASYGRASKIIAIYIKTAIVLKDSGLSIIAKVAHPPIDSILLKKLSLEHPELNVNKVKWTHLNEEDYFILINKLRKLKFEYFWELERYWNPV